MRRLSGPDAEVARWGSCTGHQPHRPAGGAHQRGAGVLVVADPVRANFGACVHDRYTVLHVNQAHEREEDVEDVARHGRPTPAELGLELCVGEARWHPGPGRPPPLTAVRDEDGAPEGDDEEELVEVDDQGRPVSP